MPTYIPAYNNTLVIDQAPLYLTLLRPTLSAFEGTPCVVSMVPCESKCECQSNLTILVLVCLGKTHVVLFHTDNRIEAVQKIALLLIH